MYLESIGSSAVSLVPRGFRGGFKVFEAGYYLTGRGYSQV